MLVTTTSFSHKRGLPEEKMAIGNIGTGSISTLAKLNTGRDHLQVAFGCTGNAPAAKRSGCLSAKREPQRGRKGPRQHRPVYFTERISERLAGTDGVEVEVNHAAKRHWKVSEPENLVSEEVSNVNAR